MSVPRSHRVGPRVSPGPRVFQIQIQITLLVPKGQFSFTVSPSMKG